MSLLSCCHGMACITVWYVWSCAYVLACQERGGVASSNPAKVWDRECLGSTAGQGLEVCRRYVGVLRQEQLSRFFSAGRFATQELSALGTLSYMPKNVLKH